MHRSPPLQEILKALYHALKPCELIQQHVDSLEPVSQRRGEVGIHLSLRGCGTDATGPLCSDPQHRSSHTCTTARDTLGPWRLLTCGTWDRRRSPYVPTTTRHSVTDARARPPRNHLQVCGPLFRRTFQHWEVHGSWLLVLSCVRARESRALRGVVSICMPHRRAARAAASAPQPGRARAQRRAFPCFWTRLHVIRQQPQIAVT